MGPFSSPRFKVHVNALNRSRPGLSTHFSLPLRGLCNGMQAMHRTGYVITEMQPMSSQQETKSSASNDGGSAVKAGKALISKLTEKAKDNSNEQKPSQVQSTLKGNTSKDEEVILNAGKTLISKLTGKDEENSKKRKPSQRNRRQRKNK